MIRGRLKLKGNYMDNDMNHDNGRLWVCWDDNRINVEYVESTDQLIHYSMVDTTGKFLYWMAAIYAQNQLRVRKQL